LQAEPEGAPLIFLAPKQATFQLERQLLGDFALGGYTRLRILSFERLAQFVLSELGAESGALLSEQGRTMTLRALMARRQKDLKIFRAGDGLARLAGYVSQEMREWQRRRYTPEGLARLSAGPELSEAVRRKLHDLGLLLGDYLRWLTKHEAQDPDGLLDLAARALETLEPGRFPVAALWMDGFAEMSAGELSLLTAVARHCQELTLAFCLEPQSNKAASTARLSMWAGIEETRRECWLRLSQVPNVEMVEEPTRGWTGRFANNAALGHLERHWTLPEPFAGDAAPALRAAVCATPEMEAVYAAREIVRFTRDRGGRYREAAVLVRSMDAHGGYLRRVFSRYGIPHFLDRRESASHHPLAELTRATLRAAAFEWSHQDWFGALKTGLVTADAQTVDALENEALQRGWKGEHWFHPLIGEGEAVASAERWRQKWIAPFERFRSELGPGRLLPPGGDELAQGIRRLWRDLRVEGRLEEWSRGEPAHLTVWEQMNLLLDDLTKAFSGETLSLREWLPIIEAGLTGLSVGVIPPAQDQVLIGAIDRSRNPELRLAIVLGLNETVFPAAPRTDSLFSEADRDQLRASGVKVGMSRLEALGREQFLGYVACTRAREELAVTWAEASADDTAINPSALVTHLKRLFPALEPEKFSGADWRNAEHPCELAGRLVEVGDSAPPRLGEMLARPEFGLLRERLQWRRAGEAFEVADLTEGLYGPALRTSVSRLEDYAACAFKFFVRSGLRAEERQIFTLDVRERGSFLHAALAAFHTEIRAEEKHWRDLTPEEGRARMHRIVDTLSGKFRDGLLAANPAARFSARTTAETLGEFVAATVAWMRQYHFDPVAAELSFGSEGSPLPPWEIDLGGGRRLIFRGIIDRIDLCHARESGEALAVVMDYKSGQKRLDEVLMRHGLQLQLAAYLGVLRQLAAPDNIFGAARLIPAGMFYVNLRGRAEGAPTRDEALRDSAGARQALFRHYGRFDFGHRDKFDSSGAVEGAQFNYKITKQGGANATNRDPMTESELGQLLDKVETQLRRMGREIYNGAVRPNPFQKGALTACQQCEFQGVCRFDGWTDSFRQLS